MSNRDDKEAVAAAEAFDIALDLIEPISDVVDMGASFELLVAVVSDAPCDLGQAAFDVMEDDRVVSQGHLGLVEQPTRDPDAHDPREGPVDLRPRVRVRMMTPSTEGRFLWRLVVPTQVVDGANLNRAELKLAFCTGQHRTSLAAWNVPSPVQSGSPFRFSVGAKCSAGCDLSGTMAVATNGSGRMMGQGALGRAPDENGLYLCNLEITAPAETGLHECLLQINAETQHLPHQTATGAVAFVVAPPGTHNVQIAVRSRETGAPVPDAQVRLGMHRSGTGHDGVACFQVASGPHRLFVWKADHTFEEKIIDVHHDLEMMITGDELPKKNPYSRWDG